MKLLVFAHTPPPHHGQSYMVKLMLDGFGGDVRRKRRSDLSAKGAGAYQPGAAPQDSRLINSSGLKARSNDRGETCAGPSALNRFLRNNLGRWPRLICGRAFGPEIPNRSDAASSVSASPSPRVSQSSSSPSASSVPSASSLPASPSPRVSASSPSPSSIECYHVNSRFSGDMEDIGEVRAEKGFLLIRYCLEAIWCRIRYGVRAFYYVPAPGKRAALYRDWAILFLCRPFFDHFILHWHAVGLGDWVKREGNWLERWITHRLHSHCTLSVALAISSMRDALWFRSRDVKIVPNGIPDPCPQFDSCLLPVRLARAEARRRLLAGEPVEQTPVGDPAIIRALYIAHCTRDKGIFDALDGVAIFNRENTQLRVHLTVAGSFLREHEEQEFRNRIAQPDLAGTVTYSGFVQGADKTRLFQESDCLCFPTYYVAEGQPVNLIEALAFGMTIITTRWRAIPEILPPDYPCFVAPQSPDQIAAAFQQLAGLDLAQGLRERFLANFSERSHLDRLQSAILSQAGY